jgi:hypothetical protein
VVVRVQVDCRGIWTTTRHLVSWHLGILASGSSARTGCTMARVGGGRHHHMQTHVPAEVMVVDVVVSEGVAAGLVVGLVEGVLMGLMSASLAIIVCCVEVCSTVVVGVLLGIVMGVVGEAVLALSNIAAWSSGASVGTSTGRPPTIRIVQTATS